MQKLKILKVQFDAQIAPYEVPAFRGAIAAKVPRDSVLYHNHDGEKLRYGYPLIQYKRIGRNPTIVCVGEGVDEIHKFFENKDWGVEISGRRLEMKIKDLDVKHLTMQVWDQDFYYRITNWLPLGAEAFREYLGMSTQEEQIRFLETKLIGNIISMAKGINWTIDKQIRVKIKEIESIKSIKFKQTKLLSFSLNFSTNVFIPHHLGLGRKAGFGHGIIRKQNNN
ncbi:CRISPR-associated endonuclease Cas6 [Flammeovirga sp. SJP92]|uniref:CRISPR-associated endonuclease Cas6 n=1 Tax=Flammeovirga sp. SJP92 TaxID=1775430 RepID=UPI0007881AD8|nr:CRISPR-associated endonuclease Cas6 [Flammeovirga sp. SJP92]KXX69433.1 hypothetical protein AVL50_19340 [Flammeovirga sp. SJP92]